MPVPVVAVLDHLLPGGGGGGGLSGGGGVPLEGIDFCIAGLVSE